MKRIERIFFGLFCLLLAASCQENKAPEPEPEPEIIEVPEDTLSVLEHIQDRGLIRAVTDKRHVNYRLLEGHPAGFQFDLLDDFTEALDLDLSLSVNDSLLECYQLLKDGEIDIFAGEIDSLCIDSSLCYRMIELPVEQDRLFAWVTCIMDGDTSLTSVIDLWMDDYKSSDLRKCYYRYYNGTNIRNDSSFRAMSHISQYDNLIKAEAKRMGWDWRLLASIIYQESHFKLDLESEQGAYGLMQLMPVTMDKYGIDYDSSVEEQLEAGGKLLLHFDQNLPASISDTLEREKFMLACYNAGMGHVLESRLAAEKHGKDPNLWTDNVEFFGPKQTYYFVKEVTKRYSHYKALIE